MTFRLTWPITAALAIASAFAGAAFVPPNPAAQQTQPPGPILDMHMHARTAAFYGKPPLPICAPVERMPRWDQRKPMWRDDDAPAPCRAPLLSPLTDAALLSETLSIMRKYNVIGVLAGESSLVQEWMAAASGRFIPALDVRFERETGAAFAPVPPGAAKKPLPVETIRQLHRGGAFRVLGEVASQYAGIAPDDARLEPLWALAEELDIPVGIHVGGGEPGTPYTGSPGFRARLQSALTLEEVLVRHPKLRVYIMHAGYPLVDDLLALLFTHPQVYIEPSMAINVETRAAFYRFLRPIIEAGYGDRVMFGSDQIIWPGLIEAAVRSIEAAPFLRPEQKRDIFYNNVARFLRLTKEEIAAHHRMAR
jgi:predicted TIM-barrel fold metal-dependent hydrolase